MTPPASRAPAGANSRPRASNRILRHTPQMSLTTETAVSDDDSYPANADVIQGGHSIRCNGPPPSALCDRKQKRLGAAPYLGNGTGLSASVCRYASISARLCGSLSPGKFIFVPGAIAFGSVIHLFRISYDQSPFTPLRASE